MKQEQYRVQKTEDLTKMIEETKDLFKIKTDSKACQKLMLWGYHSLFSGKK